MAARISKPVFYDAKQRRWRYSSRSMLFVGVLVLAVFGTLAWSIYIRPSFPALDLNRPHALSRGAPNIAQSQTRTAPVGGFNMKNFDALVAREDRRRLAAKNLPSDTHAQALAFYVNWDDNSLVSLKENIQKIDVLVPEWLHLADGNGAVVVDDQGRQDSAMEFIQSARSDLPIIPLINNFDSSTQDWDGEMLRQVLANAEGRHVLVGNILGYVRMNGFAGINVDFEDVLLTSQPDLALFMQELYGVFHPLGLTVSESIPLDDLEFNPAVLGQSSDYLILMAYDEHTLSDVLAGPIASQAWFSTALAQRLQALPSQKYVIALGNYGYDWAATPEKNTEMTFQDAITTAKESEGVVTLDASSLNPTYEYYDDNDALHHVWFLDAVSSFNQIAAAKRLGKPYGYAFWRLGSEDPMLWNVLAARDNPGAATAQSLRNMRYGYDVNYEGDGEILRVTDTPKEGSREVDFDVASGFIQNEKVTDFPSGYVVTRWGGADKKKIALTFDDGPDSKYTPKILSILKYFGVPATFFVTGANANVHPNILRSIVAQGSEIGNHTYTHPNLTMISSEQFHVELDATERLFEGFLGRKSLLFRPPYAEDIEPVTPDQVAPLESIDSLGYYTVGMHIDPGDWNRPGTDKIVADVLSEARSGVGNIVLLHDGGGNRDETVAALPRIIQGLQTSGFQLVTVSGLLGLPPESVMPPVGASERTLALTYEAAFFLVTGFNYFLQAMFFLGIVLGSARFLLVGVLAVAQRIRVSFWRHRRPMTKFVSQVAVIVPAHNEEVVIARTILSILVSEYSRMHVVVVDDGSTDRTLEILKEEFGNDSRVTIVTQENTGKAGALNHGIQYTDDTDEVIVTLDADTMFRSDTVGKLVGRFADQRIGAVAGNAKVGNRLNILTRWQALEYITSQNLDRRAFEMINCITVVPGSVGAWRRSAILEVGGFSNDTLAEDADLTFSVLRDGWHIAYEDEALAYTEAPDTVKNFIKQRFRWMFGTLQTAWKHRDTLFLPRYGALGFFAIPNIFIFQIFFPLISPLMDLMLVSSLIWAAWQKYQHPLGYSFGPTIDGIVTYYLLFLAIDLLTGILPFFFERREQWWLIVFLPLQRFFYRQLMYYVAIKVMLAALRGKLARWGKFERRATVGMRI